MAMSNSKLHRMENQNLPVVLPTGLLSMSPEEYADEFNNAAAWRTRIAEQLVAVKAQAARIEYDKRLLKAQLRHEARAAGLQLNKQQFEDELVLDKKYNAACIQELELADRRRILEASQDAINLFIQGWSRVLELRRQELVMNPPTVSRRDARRWGAA